MKNKTCGECKHFKDAGFKDPCEWAHATFDACFEFEPKQRLTNSDKIRQMDTSGLIDVIVCPYPNEVCIHRNMRGYACKCCKRDWLNAPAESEAEDAE